MTPPLVIGYAIMMMMMGVNLRWTATYQILIGSCLEFLKLTTSLRVMDSWNNFSSIREFVFGARIPTICI